MIIQSTRVTEWNADTLIRLYATFMDMSYTGQTDQDIKPFDGWWYKVNEVELA